ncbi:hypothetical protein [Streptomyces longhuiensis]|nr:hypothetical protein [Streptomyces longhuiensis]UDM05434.1 hypothetical protein LGI35_45050 [Streptomyces longhuiensis]
MDEKRRNDDDETMTGIPADDIETSDDEPDDEPADAWLAVDGDAGGGW